MQRGRGSSGCRDVSDMRRLYQRSGCGVKGLQRSCDLGRRDNERRCQANRVAAGFIHEHVGILSRALDDGGRIERCNDG